MALTTLQLVQYYQNLLILQYKGKPKAAASVGVTVAPLLLPQTSVQKISFSAVPAAGFFTLVYQGQWTAFINWNDIASTIQGYLQVLPVTPSPGLSEITVSGSIATELEVTFTGVIPPAQSLTVGTLALADINGNPIEITITETDVTLPIAVQNAFNLMGEDTAVGVQLDVLGKYTGVSRNGTGFQGQPIILDDSDFLQLIKMAIVTNNSDASLQTIQNLLNQFFPGEVFVTDYKTMRLSYLISSTIGSQNLVQMFVTQKLLPKPTGVQINVAVVPDVTILFAFRTYGSALPNGKPFNRYTAFTKTWQWLSYVDIL